MRSIPVLAIVCLTTAPAWADDNAPLAGPPAWQATLDVQPSYSEWNSSQGWPANQGGGPKGGGSQFYLPIGLQFDGHASENLGLNIVLRSGYASARQSTAGLTGSSSSLTNSSVSVTAIYYGWDGTQPFLSVAVNVPTGKPTLGGNAAFAKGDPDVVPLPTFGEGWNFAPTLGAGIPLNEDTIASFALGYTHRGPFQREGAGPGLTTQLDPGDVLTVNASIGYQDNVKSLSFSASFSGETATTLDHSPFYRSGNRVILGLSATYAWNEAWSSRTSLTWSHYNKNDVKLAGLPVLVIEAFNSNSSDIPIEVDTIYSHDNYSLGPSFNFYHRDHNSWSPTTFQFLPASTSVGVGFSGQYAASDRLTFAAGLNRNWLVNQKDPQKIVGGVPVPGSAVPEYSVLSWQLHIGATYGL